MILSCGSRYCFPYTEVKRIEIWGSGYEEKGAAWSPLNALKEDVCTNFNFRFFLYWKEKNLCDPLQKILLEKFWTYILIPLDVA